MFFILAVLLIAIGGILFILFFDEKPKPVKNPKVDDRAIAFDQNTTDQVDIVFDEPSEIQHININRNLSGNLESSNQADQIQDAAILHPESNQELTTNSKINPFNF